MPNIFRGFSDCYFACGKKTLGIVGEMYCGLPKQEEIKVRDSSIHRGNVGGSRFQPSDVHSPIEALVSLFGESTFVLDSKGIICNAWICDTRRRHQLPATLIGRRLQNLLGEAHHEKLAEIFTRVLCSNQKECFEYGVERLNGLRWFQSLVIPLNDCNAKSKRIGLLSRDATRQRQAEEKLRKSEALLRQAEQLAGMGSWVYNLKTCGLQWSENMYRIMGFEPRQVTPSLDLFWRMVPPEDKERAEKSREEALIKRRATETEIRSFLPDGRVRVLHTQFVPVFSETGDLLRIVGTTQDVTERRNEEDRLRRSQALLAQAEKIAHVGGWEWDVETDEIMWSEERYRMLGLEPHNHPMNLGLLRQFFHPEDSDLVNRSLQRVVAEGRPIDHEGRCVRADGSVRLFHTRASPVFGPSGRVVRVVGMSQDITERRKQEEHLRRSEALLAHAEEIAGFESWEYNVRTKSITLSKHLVRMYGLQSADEWDEERYWNSFLLADRDVLRRDYARAVAECQPFEFVGRFGMPGGDLRVYHTRASQLPEKTERLDASWA